MITIVRGRLPAALIGSDTGIVRRLWRPGLKLIVVTYCVTPEMQAEAYRQIHEIATDDRE